MLTIQEVNDILDHLVDELPQEVFTELNGGISLVPKRKVNPVSRNNDLLILGEYQWNIAGRMIVIYYGSIAEVMRDQPPKAWENRLREVLRHEFLHHVELMAGKKDLEEWDAVQMERYKRGLALETEEERIERWKND